MAKYKGDTKMKNTKKTIAMAVRIILALAGITCIILSMIKDVTYPYLAIGLGLTAAANFINCYSIKKMKEEENGSAEDRSIS